MAKLVSPADGQSPFAVGYNREMPQQVYDGCFTEVRHGGA